MTQFLKNEVIDSVNNVRKTSSVCNNGTKKEQNQLNLKLQEINFEYKRDNREAEKTTEITEEEKALKAKDVRQELQGREVQKYN